MALADFSRGAVKSRGCTNSDLTMTNKRFRTAILAVVASVSVACSTSIQSPPNGLPPIAVSASETSSAPGVPVPVPEVVTLLDRLVIVPELPQIPGYERSCSKGSACVFGPAWADIERAGCDTRNRVLREQLSDVTFKPGTRDCKVLTGSLHDPYSGSDVAFDFRTPRAVEIDHVFALARAWDAGAASWSSERRLQFANDMTNLLAVTRAQNGAKSDSGPGDWMPADRDFACPYVMVYLRAAAKYQLSITDDDRGAALVACGAQN